MEQYNTHQFLYIQTKDGTCIMCLLLWLDWPHPHNIHKDNNLCWWWKLQKNCFLIFWCEKIIIKSVDGLQKPSQSHQIAVSSDTFGLDRRGRKPISIFAFLVDSRHCSCGFLLHVWASMQKRDVASHIQTALGNSQSST